MTSAEVKKLIKKIENLSKMACKYEGEVLTKRAAEPPGAVNDALLETAIKLELASDMLDAVVTELQFVNLALIRNA